MKLPIRSLRVPFSFQRDRLRFYGKSTVLNLHEIGITIEGMVPDVYYPVLMPILWRAVSNWTIRTIPFSRIIKCQARGHERLGLLLLTFTVLLSISLIVLMWNLWWLCLMLITALGVLYYLVVRRVLKRSIEIEYLTYNSKACAIRLRFRSIEDEQRWFEELSRHRLENTAPTLAQAARSVTSRRSLWQRIFRPGARK
jgi:hypothetical protein